MYIGSARLQSARTCAPASWVGADSLSCSVLSAGIAIVCLLVLACAARCWRAKGRRRGPPGVPTLRSSRTRSHTLLSQQYTVLSLLVCSPVLVRTRSTVTPTLPHDVLPYCADSLALLTCPPYTAKWHCHCSRATATATWHMPAIHMYMLRTVCASIHRGDSETHLTTPLQREREPRRQTWHIQIYRKCTHVRDLSGQQRTNKLLTNTTDGL